MFRVEGVKSFREFRGHGVSRVSMGFMVVLEHLFQVPHAVLDAAHEELDHGVGVL